MSRLMKVAPYDHVRKEGAKVCRMCGNPLPSRRTSHCSDECSEDFKVRMSSSYARYKVGERDKGICAICGVDTLRVEKWVRHMQEKLWQAHKATWSKQTERHSDCIDRVFRWARKVQPNWRRDGELWQADHIVPVVEGGGGCGLDNLRTLCTKCHLAETARLARRRSKAGRLPSNESLFGVSP